MQNRTRFFACTVYPDSAPSGWQQTLEAQCIPCFISPLHDKDVDDSGVIKKPHFHVLLLYEGLKTVEQARETFSLIGGVGCEVVKSTRAYSRYLCHLDNKDKAQYDPDDVVALSGADYAEMISQARSKYSAIGEMIEYCIATDLNSYSELLLYAKKNRQDWFRVLCDSSVAIINFMKSRTWQEEYNRKRR